MLIRTVKQGVIKMKKEYIIPMIKFSTVCSAEVYCADVKSSPDADGLWNNEWDNEQSEP